jgi:GNAT superfamily N-acetyltransferase
LAGEPTIRRAANDEILDLRHRILRAGLPRDTARFAGDEDAETRHLAAVDGGGRIIGCLSLLLRPWQDQPAWQLRGMAVDADEQRRGVGRSLLTAAEREVLGDGRLRLIWCNARESAIGFYQKGGWQIASEPFIIAVAGVHRRMTRRL